MSDRVFEVSLNESQWDVVISALDALQSKCNRTATMTRKAGYGTVTTLEKARKWEMKAEEVKEILSAITDKAL